MKVMPLTDAETLSIERELNRLLVTELRIEAECSNGAVLSDTGCSGGVDGNHGIC